MSKYIGRKMLFKSRYRDYLKSYSKEEIDILSKRIDELIKENKEYCDKGNYKHLANIFTALSLYEYLKTKMSKEDAFKIVSEEMHKYVEKGAGIYRYLFPKGNMLKIMGKLLPKMFKKGSGYGWKYTWHMDKVTNDYLKFECNKCIYHQIYKKYKIPELGPMFCYADDINYGKIPGIKFTRNHTLCRDGKDCDFLFERVNNNE